ncbi:MAG: dihydroorotate dehydrogenase electron transfer subunit [Deltaproteobacteria bacterium]|nr:dihydroorotate dehydrogenase electron transfer subunit [Deltaproteobacteria bacterium]
MNYSDGTGKIISNIEVAPSHYRMDIEATFDLKTAGPGQFVMVKVSDGMAPILRRPFGIYTIDEEKDSFAILYRVVGEGTRLLSEMAAGVKVDVLGPLGKGFSFDISGERPLLVAGGVGVPPLFNFARGLVEKEIMPLVLIGGRSKSDLLSVDEFEKLGIMVKTATEDGSEGHKGYVTDIMEAFIAGGVIPTTVYSCGPELMLKRVGEIAMAKGLPCELSLEAMMACGFGVCLGCVIKTCTVENVEDHDYGRVCTEGPVFDAREIIWE